MSELVPSGSSIPEEASETPNLPAVPSHDAVPVENEAGSSAYAVAAKEGKLASERVIINAPMSFAGAAQRAWRLQESGTGVWRWAILAAVVLVLIPSWWFLVLCWYIAFGLWLVPYRVLRRGARKRKKEALRHRELLTALEQQKD